MKTKLFTEVKVIPAEKRLDFDAGVVSLGSCFSERIANWLARGGMNVEANPCGIVYNAFSIAGTVQRLAQQRYFVKEDFFQHDGRWRTWEHHGSFAEPDLPDALAKCNVAMENFRNAAAMAQLFVITFSTSLVFELKANGQVVSNCHKVSGEKFNRRLLKYHENLNAIENIVRDVSIIAPHAQLVFSLSPVRHLPGDPVLNARSKASLLAAIHDVSGNPAYFPSYEIMNDELRDYRFYALDMTHPSELAEEIICTRFAEAWFTDDAITNIASGHKQFRFTEHRSIYGNSHA
ncbi:MAG: GSCFA domain-containing protein [Victivallaceae bacterium]|nr:GSCFA domain-containing protein [Victivallaceae bacterium]MDD5664282.1 GSCFA domain-containing protein [Victivallaceae bacterium]